MYMKEVSRIIQTVESMYDRGARNSLNCKLSYKTQAKAIDALLSRK